MEQNKYSLSNLREQQEQKKNQKNAVQRIVTLVNIYHSVENRPVSDKEKKDFQKEVAKEIDFQLKYVGEGMRSHIKASLQSPTYWEEFRERIL